MAKHTSYKNQQIVSNPYDGVSSVKFNMTEQSQENKYSTAYYKILPHFVDEKIRIIDCKGGYRASKTYTILQILTIYAMMHRKDSVIKIIGQSLRHLNDNVITQMREICNNYGINFDRMYKDTKRIITINKTKFLFLSADVDNVLGGECDITFVNEANAKVFKWEIIQQLIERSKKKFIFDYNPKNKFWKHSKADEWMAHPYVSLHFTYKDNEYLDKGILENIKRTKKGTWFYNVFVLGEEALPEGIIFTNWTTGYWKEGIPYVYAIDFGSTDPESIVKVGYDKDENKTYVEEIYWDDKINKGTQGIVDAAVFCKERDQVEARARNKTLFKEVNYNPVFIPDPAGKDKIVDMRKKGLNCPKFVKPDLVWSIREMQEGEIVVCGESYNIKEELGSYIWKNFDALIPEDANNHTIDPIRYGRRYLTSKGIGIVRNAYARR